MRKARTSSVATKRETITKTTCIIPEAVTLWDQHSRDLRRGRGGRKSRSLALAALIDDYERKGEAVEHSWSYSRNGGGDQELKKLNFDITASRLQIVEGIRKHLSGFEGGDVGLGFAITALLFHQLGSPPREKAAGRKRMAARAPQR